MDKKKVMYFVKCLSFFAAYFIIGDWFLGKLNEYTSRTFDVMARIVGTFALQFIFGALARFEKIRSLFDRRKKLVISWPDIVLALLPWIALLVNIFMSWGWRHLAILGLAEGYFAAGMFYREQDTSN